MPGQNIPAAEPTPTPDLGLDSKVKELNDRLNAALRQQIEREVRAEIADEITAELALSNREMTDLRKIVDVFADGDDHHDTLMDLVNATGKVWLRYAARAARGGQA